MSLTLGKNFGDAPGARDYPLEVEIANDCTMTSLSVHRGCVLELFCERYLIDLVPIALQGTKIIVGIDWLSHNRDMIDYKHQLVRV